MWLGFSLADPIVGLLIAAAILVIMWQSGKMVFARLLDGVDPALVDEMRNAATSVEGVEDVAEVRARWVGHRLRAEVNVAVDLELSVEEGHAVAREVYHRLMHELGYLDSAVVHVDPAQESGEGIIAWPPTLTMGCPPTHTEVELEISASTHPRE